MVWTIAPQSYSHLPLWLSIFCHQNVQTHLLLIPTNLQYFAKHILPSESTVGGVATALSVTVSSTL